MLEAEFAALGGPRMPDDFFDARALTERQAAEALVIDVDGFEGPLDLLLTLSRAQRVDLCCVFRSCASPSST